MSIYEVLLLGLCQFNDINNILIEVTIDHKQCEILFYIVCSQFHIKHHKKFNKSEMQNC